jgi:hypothetical protein
MESSTKDNSINSHSLQVSNTRVPKATCILKPLLSFAPLIHLSLNYAAKSNLTLRLNLEVP